MSGRGAAVRCPPRPASAAGADEPGAEALEEGPRPPAAIEAAVYFTVAEALTNTVRHGGGRRAEVRLERLRTGVRAVISDDGHGGADERAGTGLLGVRRRVAALDGEPTVSSPAGGPTVIVVELPCVW